MFLLNALKKTTCWTLVHLGQQTSQKSNVYDKINEVFDDHDKADIMTFEIYNFRKTTIYQKKCVFADAIK